MSWYVRHDASKEVAVQNIPESEPTLRAYWEAREGYTVLRGRGR